MRSLPLVHFFEVSLYALCFFLLRDGFHLGGLNGNFYDSFSTYLYFSLATFTTIGFGDIVPVGANRFLAGIEGLNGILLVGWSGSFIFLVRRRYRRMPGRKAIEGGQGRRKRAAKASAGIASLNRNP